MELITIARCDEPWRAQLIKTTLEAHGIKVFLQGLEFAHSLGGVGGGLAGIDVRVEAGCAEKARQLLDELEGRQ